MFIAAGKKRKFAPDTRFASEHTLLRRQRSDVVGAMSLVSPSDTKETINRWYIIGMENFRERQYRTALDYYNRAIALSMNEGLCRDARLYEARSHVLYKLREFVRAMDDAKEAIVIDAGSTAGYTHMAGILAATGKLYDALAVLEQGLCRADRQSTGYPHMLTLRASLMKQLDPTAKLPVRVVETDPVVRLPADLAILVLRELNTRTLILCRAVSKRWLALIDNTPVLWSRVCFSYPTAVSRLAQQLPAYTKVQKWIIKNSSDRVPDKILRFAFKKAQGSLVTAFVPEKSVVSTKTLDLLLAQNRPCLKQIDVSSTAAINSSLVERMLGGWCMPTSISTIRFPYCTNVDNNTVSIIARCVPRLRILDISGCAQVRVKHLFKAWSSVLADAYDSTSIEELYMNDHPGIPDLLVYSTRHCHFANVKTLHIAIQDQRVFSMFSGLAPLVEYLRRNQNSRTLFPRLTDLNMNGIWDATVASQRFESTLLHSLVFQCRLVAEGLSRLSAVDSSAISRTQLVESLQRCLPTMQHLHITRAANFDTQILLDIVARHQQLYFPLVSLDLSGCVGITAQGIYAFISRCRSLVYANLSQTAANNTVMNIFTENISTLSLPGLEALVIDTTDISGAAVRDFAAACAKRYNSRLRSETHVKRVWRLQLLDIDNCTKVGSDAVAVVRELLSPMSTQVLAAIPE
ncbi:hypothetical protein GGI25_005389 [Coemansia spiralis]|uniref:F-box domain-containing protein n=2 Tax=Coemansia TaxID=4863 RepID=A0A9W8G2N8_9FUNG|nr:hypothetical protein BX070DRAFT_229157 [Coemansia spiralis]KAJ1991227.1 hypothetical protein EDC05_003589 [Coemansia umbellata]KAJ2621197.1 hypothetical protein GGI26_004366 [Coemansia sp. RSA 1358]KAJ2671698.1 hypothetical protein GGI25_005389 [Coemansia spiralis]